MSSNVKVKICGLSREMDIQTANELRLDYIGFIFAKKSHRYVSPERAAQLKALLSPDILAVGVFVNEDPSLVAQLITDGVIDIAQLHGSEDDEYISDLRSLLNLGESYEGDKIWKAFRIDSDEDIIKANASTADRVLVDHGAGGTGESFDWSLLDGMTRPYILAGGLNLDNVASALSSKTDNGFLYGLDISSGVETDKLKDSEKMRLFTVNARR